MEASEPGGFVSGAIAYGAETYGILSSPGILADGILRSPGNSNLGF